MKNSIYKITQTLKKIKLIAFSRLKKVENETYIEERRKVCETCQFNSINAYNVSLWARILKWLSDFYSLITFNKDVDVLGSCLACQSCSIYYKSIETAKSETCPKGKWKHIKLPRKHNRRNKMEIEKLTEKYNLYEENGTYYLAFGAIKNGEDTTTKLRFTDVDSKTFQITPTCQCTASNKKIIDDKTVETDISIKTSGAFTKTVTLKNQGKITLLKLVGTYIK